MKLIRCHIENFGTLHQTSRDFTQGVNPVFAGNGEGKSTLAAFIKAMFYGLPKSRIQDLDGNPRKKYKPWQGGAFGGSIEFEAGGHRYRLERFFEEKGEDSFALFNTETGLPSKDFGPEIGRELFGINEEGYARSIYIAQSPLDSQKDNQSLTCRLTSLLENADNEKDFRTAEDILKNQKKRYKADHGSNDPLGQNEVAIQAVRHRMEECRIAGLRVLELEQEVKKCAEREKELSEKIRAYHEAKARAAEAGNKKVCRDALQEMLEDRNRRVKEKEELEEFFGGHPLTQEEIEACAKDIRDWSEIEIKTNLHQLSARAEEERKSLAKTYATAVLSEEVSQRILQAAYRYENVTKELIDESGLSGKENLPTRETLALFQQRNAQLKAYQRDAEDKRKRLSERSSREEEGRTVFQKYQRRERTGWILTAVFALAAMAATAGVILNFSIVTGVLLGVSLAATITFLLLTLRWKRLKSADILSHVSEETENERQELLKLEGKIEGEERDIRDFLQKYRLSTEDATQSLDELSDSVTQRETREKEKAQLEGELTPFCLRFGKPAEPATLADAAKTILCEMKEYAALDQKARSAQVEREKAEKEISSIQERLLSVPGFGFSSEEENPVLSDFEKRRTECQDKSKRYEQLSAEIRQATARIESYKKEKGISEEMTFTEMSPEESERLETEWQACENDRADCLRESQRLQTELTQQRDISSEYSLAQTQLETLQEEKKTMEDRVDTLKKAMEFLRTASEALSSRYLGGMRKAFSDYLTMCGLEKIGESTLDSSLQLTVREGAASRSPEYYSRGERDLLTFCMRLSLLDELFPGEKPVLVLDDPFVNLDENHCEQVRKLLKHLEKTYQIIYFYCHEARSFAG